MIRIADYIKHWEGFRDKFYTCPAGKLTIGYGRNVQDNPFTEEEYKMLFPELSILKAMIEIVKNGITESQAEKLLNIFIIETTCDMMRNYTWYRNLSLYRRMVILDMIYNLGLGDFMRFKKMIKALEGRNYVNASNEIEDSRYYRQVGSRAKSNVHIMLHDDIPDYVSL